MRVDDDVLDKFVSSADPDGFFDERMAHDLKDLRALVRQFLSIGEHPRSCDLIAEGIGAACTCGIEEMRNAVEDGR